MALYYSLTSKGFYDTDLGYDAYPNDIIEITPEQYRELLDGVNLQGKEIYLNDNILALRDKTIVITWNNVRDKRNYLLTKSDYTQIPDFPSDKTAWVTYRQALRDLPQTYTNAADVIWPIAPGA
jgi:hypothetical protein